MSKDRFPVIYLVKFGGLVEAPSAMLLYALTWRNKKKMVVRCYGPHFCETEESCLSTQTISICCECGKSAIFCLLCLTWEKVVILLALLEGGKLYFLLEFDVSYLDMVYVSDYDFL